MSYISEVVKRAGEFNPVTRGYIEDTNCMRDQGEASIQIYNKVYDLLNIQQKEAFQYLWDEGMKSYSRFRRTLDPEKREVYFNQTMNLWVDLWDRCTAVWEYYYNKNTIIECW